jgi:hypothetical protein
MLGKMIEQVELALVLRARAAGVRGMAERRASDSVATRNGSERARSRRTVVTDAQRADYPRLTRENRDRSPRVERLLMSCVTGNATSHPAVDVAPKVHGMQL